VARSPLEDALRQASRGFIEGSGPRGTRRSPPHRKSLNEGMLELGSRSPGGIG
jgi:hypothetical protein